MKKLAVAGVLTVLLLTGQQLPAAEPAKPDVTIDLKLAGLDFNAAVTSLSEQSRAVFIIDAQPRQLGPDIQLTGLSLISAIGIVAAAYGVCIDTRPPVTIFRDCDASYTRAQRSAGASEKSTRGVALLGAEVSTGVVKSPGALVLRVLPDSVAFAAGLQPGDTIVGLDGRIIGNPIQLREAVDVVQLGTSIALEILRHGQRESLDAQF